MGDGLHLVAPVVRDARDEAMAEKKRGKYGDGTVRERRPGRFHARCSIGGKDTSVGTFDSEAEAWDAIADVQRSAKSVRAKRRVADENVRLSAIEKKLSIVIRALGAMAPDGGRRLRRAARRAPSVVEPHAPAVGGKRAARYGLDAAAYAELFQRQGGACAICGATFGDDTKPVIDHDHEAEAGGSVVVRGLLCSGCNIAEGHYRSSVESHLRGALYLLRSGAPYGSDVADAVAELAKLMEGLL